MLVVVLAYFTRKGEGVLCTSSSCWVGECAEVVVEYTTTLFICMFKWWCGVVYVRDTMWYILL